jgi:pheromone shutdown protein TraB
MNATHPARKHLLQIALNWALLVALMYCTVPALFSGSPLLVMTVLASALLAMTPVSIAVDVVAARVQNRYHGHGKALRAS